MVRKDSDARDEQARVRSLGISHHGGSKNARTQGHRNCLHALRGSAQERTGAPTERGPTMFGTRAEWRRNAGSMLFLEGELALAVEGGDSIRGVFVVEGGYQDGGPLTRWSPSLSDSYLAIPRDSFAEESGSRARGATYK